jgi:hypothetical protein
LDLLSLRNPAPPFGANGEPARYSPDDGEWGLEQLEGKFDDGQNPRWGHAAVHDGN